MIVYIKLYNNHHLDIVQLNDLAFKLINYNLNDSLTHNQLIN